MPEKFFGLKILVWKFRLENFGTKSFDYIFGTFFENFQLNFRLKFRAKFLVRKLSVKFSIGVSQSFFFSVQTVQNQREAIFPESHFSQNVDCSNFSCSVFPLQQIFFCNPDFAINIFVRITFFNLNYFIKQNK